LEERLAQLTDQVTSLSNQIVVARAELGKAVQPPLTPAQAAAKARHQKAVQTFNRFVDENIRIKNEMDKASGARRAELLDQLKARRYQEQSLQRELRDAQAAFEQLQPPPHPKADIEKRIRTLTEEYRRTIRQIEAAQNDLEQTDNPVETHET
jgi:vacuolar-type H+-ATPase subunit D/Vma8